MRKRWFRITGVCFLGCLVWGGGVVAAGIPKPVPPTVDTAGLPALGEERHSVNPYRENAAVLETGRRIFNQGCAVCHGEDAKGDRAPAPDLRGLQVYCRRIEDDALRNRCQDDVDVYFAKSVLEGKRKVGVVHMPAWGGVLSQEQLWAIKTFIESQR